MTMPVPYGSTQVDTIPGELVEPTAIASGKDSAIHGLGEAIKALIHGSPAAFHGENARLTALSAVDKWVGSHVPLSALRAVRTGEEFAPVEDVAMRVPPPQVTFGTPVNQGPGIDYDRLAAAIVRQQAAMDAQKPAPEPEPVQDTPPQKAADKPPVITDVPAKGGKA